MLNAALTCALKGRRVVGYKGVRVARAFAIVSTSRSGSVADWDLTSCRQTVTKLGSVGEVISRTRAWKSDRRT